MLGGSWLLAFLGMLYTQHFMAVKEPSLSPSGRPIIGLEGQFHLLCSLGLYLASILTPTPSPSLHNLFMEGQQHLSPSI